MTIRNARASNFNPVSLQPAGAPSRIPFGAGNPESQEYMQQTPMTGPDGRNYIQQQVIGPDGQPRGAPQYIAKNPDGSTQAFQPGANGQWVEGEFHKRNFAEAVFGDEKLMTFAAVAGAGALAGSAIGTGGAGGSMLGGGTGATPGIVAGGTMGTAGLGAATGTGLIGTMGGGYDTQGLDQLIAQQEAAHAGGGAENAGFFSQLGNWLTSNNGQGGGLDNLFDLFGGAGGLVRDVGSLALMREMYEDNKGNAQEWRNWMEQGTPDLGFYQGKLKNAYDNPGAFLQGPEYQAAQNIVHNKLQRNDAAGGRLANDFGRQVALQDHAMGALSEYRNGLSGLVNQQQQTRAGIGSGALENAQAAESDWMKNMMNWLNSQGS